MTTKKTEIVTATSTAIAPVDYDPSNIEGFDRSDFGISSLTLVQGSNDLKKLIGAQDGDFVIDNEIQPKPLEFILVKTAKFYDEYTYVPLKPDGKMSKESKYIKTLTEAEFTALPNAQENYGKIWTVATPEGTRLFQCKKTFLVSIGGTPVKIDFKSISKHLSAANMVKKIMSRTKRENLPSTICAVFQLFTVEKYNDQEGATYHTFDANFVREATEEEIIEATSFMDLPLVKIAAPTVEG